MSDEKNQDEMADSWAAALDEQTGESGDAAGAADVEAGDAWADALNEQAEAEVAPLQEMSENSTFASAEGDVNLDMILDIPVDISMEIGRTKISIRNLLQLTQGSVVELDRLAGEPLDVMVNGTLIAHGEVVVVNEKFGIRLTDVISATERIKRLK
ncbi:MAG: flagellar motor switch protein FliN [Gammaproteobacteria bacterium]|nr:flagellar motor switch protein FliN [Gammaproteobacteria bacterium]MCF6229490.1 flagellar motor switch protein FliN [Gammaproteobacteria bacterium]